eukprot:TRINITY_DN24491_c0_g1_i1.p1 TRINITY_DN24491_c0_g1~~TRINITY_DN24491_c0_g1_i1.p1  ORF type:complete len:189 (-),score=16.55 TRINITY_DN24491_c0_g1_i1:109-675(-)
MLSVNSFLLLFHCFCGVVGWPTGVDDSECRRKHLTEEQYAELKRMIEDNPVAVVTLDRPMRCTNAALARLDEFGTCYLHKRFADEQYVFGRDSTISHPIWRYHTCQYPDNDVGGIQMHSYVWIGQKMHGNGFDLLADSRDSRLRSDRYLNDTRLVGLLDSARAQRNCVGGNVVKSKDKTVAASRSAEL